MACRLSRLTLLLAPWMKADDYFPAPDRDGGWRGPAEQADPFPGGSDETRRITAAISPTS